MIFGTSYLKRLFFLLILLVTGEPLLFAQETPTTADVPDTTINTDSTREISILIIPYNPKMYFSDADKDISETSQMDKGKVSKTFSGSLEKNLYEHIGLYYATKSISKQADAQEELDIIYGSLNYDAKQVENKEEAEKPSDNTKKKLKKLGDRLKKRLNQDNAENDPDKAKKDNDLYMDISFDDNRLLDHLHNKYKTEYFLFINQFEVVTDYENCIDLQLRKYYREIKVHYTLFSKSGKRISGNMVTLPYHSNENDISAIIRDNFSQVSSEILNQIYLKQ